MWDFLTRLGDDDRSIPPPLEPLLPALAETVLFWSGGTRQVLVIHDEQSALTAGRLSRLQQVLADGAATSPLAGLVMVDSWDDPRVQVADLLAAARRPPGSSTTARSSPRPHCATPLSGDAADPVDGQPVLVEQAAHDPGEVHEVRRREVGVEVLGGLPVLVEDERARILDALVEVVVDVAGLLAGRLDERLERRLESSSLPGAASCRRPP